MLDGFKILRFPKYPKDIISITDFNFKMSVDRETGDIEKEYCEYEGLKIIVKPGLVQVKGSLHKFFNQGKHNYNKFSYSEIIETLIRFCELFKINAHITHLNGLEFGVNIIINESTEKVINAIKSHKGKEVKDMNIRDGFGITIEHDNYLVKIYNKSLQYNLTENVLRFEVKVNVMRYFKDNNLQVKTISDLFNYGIYPKLGDLLLKQVDMLYIFDSDNLNSQTPLNIQHKLLIESNPKYWSNLNPCSKDYEKGNKDRKYKYDRKKYNIELIKNEKLLSKYQKRDLKKELKKYISDSINELLIVNESTLSMAKNYLEKNSYYTSQNHNQKISIGTNSDFTETGTISDFSYSMNLSHKIDSENRYCKVTGLNISMQRKDSEYLCLTGLRYYKENDSKTFDQIKREYLTEYWYTSSETKQLTEIAHNIRNRANNTRNSFNKINEYPSLFDNSTLVDSNTLRFIR